MTERVTKPKHSMTITEYGELQNVVDAFSNGKLNLVILVGGAGIAKSQTVRRALAASACWIEGNVTSYGMYQELYRHRDEHVVIDDVDSLYSDKSAVRLLKGLCQTDEVKSLGWHSASTVFSKEDGIPNRFDTKSRVLIIANDFRVLNANVAAVQDRGHLIYFEPSAEAVHMEVAKWFTDQQVFDWFADHLHLIAEPSMRHYVRAAELKAAGMDFVKVLLSDAIPEKALLVAKLKGDASFKHERDRVKRFTELGGGNATTWYKWAKRIQAKSDTAHLKMPLPNAPSEDGSLFSPKLRVVG